MLYLGGGAGKNPGDPEQASCRTDQLLEAGGGALGQVGGPTGDSPQAFLGLQRAVSDADRRQLRKASLLSSGDDRAGRDYG